MSGSDTKTSTSAPAEGETPVDAFARTMGKTIEQAQNVLAPVDEPGAPAVVEPGGAGAVPPIAPPALVGVAGSTGDGLQQGNVAVLDPDDDPRPRRRVATIGYTTSREEAPYGADGWELWGMNNLHKHPDIAARIETFTRWYNLHPLTNLEKEDPEHLAWLMQPHPFPIYVFDPLAGVDVVDGEPTPPLCERLNMPSVVAFPAAQILARFRPYFTNTVSWQLAHLILESLEDDSYLLSEVGLFGIDMAIGSEYAAQRPSVEYYLGLLDGLGTQLIIPEASDLLKAAQLYGGAEEQHGGMGAKVATRVRELEEQKVHLESQLDQGRMIHASVCGALDSFRYMQAVWLPPTTKTNRDAVVVPAGSHSPVAQMIAEGEARERNAPKET